MCVRVGVCVWVNLYLVNTASKRVLKIVKSKLNGSMNILDRDFGRHWSKG